MDQFTYEAVNTGASTTTALTVSPTSSVYGQSVTLTATVTSPMTQAGGPTPTGTVTFYENTSTKLGSATLNSSGQATLSTSALAVGTDSITAVYGGDSTYGSSTSAAVSENVSKDASNTALSLSAASVFCPSRIWKKPPFGLA